MANKNYKKKNKKSIIVRTALWEAYNRKCFYCDELISNIDNLEIDHILPEWLLNNHKKFEEIIKKYELDNNFELNSYYNLVPTNSGCNKKKSGYLYEKRQTLFFLSQTKLNLERITEIEDKLKKEKDKSNELNKLGINIEKGLINEKEVIDLIKAIKLEKLQNPLIISFIFHMKNVYNKIPKNIMKSDYESYKWLENNLIIQLSSQINGTFSKLEQEYLIGDIYILKIAFWGVNLDSFETFRNPYWDIYEINTFDELYRISAKKYYDYSFKFTRPIFKSKNWDCLKDIPSKKITTEVILGEKPKFDIRQGNYIINNQKLVLEIDDKNNYTIIRFKGKIIEHEFSSDKCSNKDFEPIPQKIPYFLKANLNEIFRQNNISKDKFLKDICSVSIIVNYKINNEIIATSEYLKITNPIDLEFDGTAYYLPSKTENLYKLEPKNYKEWNNRGVVFYNQKNYTEAIKCFKKALDINPNEANSWNNLGCLYDEQLNYNDAVKSFVKALEIKPTDIAAMINLGNLYDKNGKHNEALIYYQKALNIDPTNDDLLYNIGVMYNNQNDYEKAKIYYQKSIDLKTKNPNVWNNLGKIYNDEKNFNLAKNCFENAINLDIKHISAWLNLGNSCFYQEDYINAKFHYIKVLELKPKHDSALYNLGCVFYKEKNFFEAKNYFEKVLDIDPKNYNALVKLGFMNREKNEICSAINYFEKALNIEPNNIDLLNSLGILYGTQENYIEAEELFKRILVIDSNNQIAIRNLIFLNLKILEKDSKNYNALKSIAELNINLKNYQTAETYFNKMLELNPNDSFTWNALGIIYIEMNDYKRAESSWRESINKNPKNAAAWVNLCLYYINQKNIEEARLCYKQASKLEIKDEKNKKNFDKAKDLIDYFNL